MLAAESMNLGLEMGEAAGERGERECGCGGHPTLSPGQSAVQVLITVGIYTSLWHSLPCSRTGESPQPCRASVMWR